MSEDIIYPLIETEIGRIPEKLKVFLSNDSGYSAFDQTMGFYAHGYAAAFEELAAVCLRYWPRRDYLRLPLFCLGRHSIELSIKEAIEIFNSGDSDNQTATGHNIPKLWNRLLEAVEASGFPVDDKWTIHCTSIVNHIHEFDPNGERFRYLHKRTGEKFELTQIDIENLVREHWNLNIYCGIAISSYKTSWER